MRDIFAKLDIPIKLFLILWLLVLTAFLAWGKLRPHSQPPPVVQTENFTPQGVVESPVTQQPVDMCGSDCEGKIQGIVDSAVSTISAKLVDLEQKQASLSKLISVSLKPQPKSQQTNYVPVGSSGSTQKTDWTDLANTDFFLDVGTYGKIIEAKWSANIKIFQNGESFARLYDATHGVAIPNSEISTKSYSYSLVESGNLTFLPGKNVYRVQMKSLTGYEASFDSGRIKIVSEQ